MRAFATLSCGTAGHVVSRLSLHLTSKVETAFSVPSCRSFCKSLHSFAYSRSQAHRSVCQSKRQFRERGSVPSSSISVDGRRTLCCSVGSTTSAKLADGALPSITVEEPTETAAEKSLGANTKSGASVGYQKRIRIADLKGGIDGGIHNVGKDMVIRGWVRTVRNQKSFAFVEVNDGSSLSGMQVVVPADSEGFSEVPKLATGASVSVEGKVVESKGGKQKIELLSSKLTIVGLSDGTTYPLQKKRHSFEFLRSIAHLRPRTNTIGAVSRVRGALAYATHQFFRDNNFVWVAAPIITASDCEGAGEQFCVTTLIPESAKVSAVPATEEGRVNWEKDFFERPAYLTVSGQLNAEIYACALHDVYTFGPTFRAENSNTARHLAEFWMIEPELAFADLKDDMACATAYLKHVVAYVLENCKEDMEFFDKFIEQGIIKRLTSVVESEFAHITYTDAVDLLLKAPKKFEFPVEWGCDLQSEHERYITEVEFSNRPVIVTDYPKKLKAFYMRENDDGKTVAAMDVLVPRVGELMGGSQREERLDVLKRRIAEVGLSEESYWWYLDLRRYGSVPHAGFGVGFERLVQFTTGMENIRDVIPFPRAPGLADF